jgi:hypothetical protein
MVGIATIAALSLTATAKAQTVSGQYIGVLNGGASNAWWAECREAVAYFTPGTKVTASPFTSEGLVLCR